MSARKAKAIRRTDRRQISMSTPLRCLKPEEWEGSIKGSTKAVPVKVWKSSEFLAVLYNESGILRLSVNRAYLVEGSNRWDDGITWDELMFVKTQCCLHESWAIEIYPPIADVVDVANMRHLWILPSPPSFAWRKGGVL